MWGATFSQVWSDKDKPPDAHDGTIPLRCSICGTHTDARIAGRVVTPDSRFVQLPHHVMKVYNYLACCTRCQSGILVMWSYGEEVNGDAYSAGRLVFPFPTAAFGTEQLPRDLIPSAVYEDLRQAELAYLARSHYGAGLLLRRACQNICRQQGIPDVGGLKGQIKELASRGTITKSLAEQAESIRVIGNELAHPDPNTPSVIQPGDVRLAMEFLDQLVRAIYVDPARVKELKADLQKRGVE